MEAYRVDAVVDEKGNLTLRNLPFRSRQKLEVILLQRGDDEHSRSYPLCGEPVEYLDPFGGVSEDEWDVSD